MKTEPTKHAYQIAIGIGIGIFLLIFCVFVSSLFDSHPGEIAGATGAVVGGTIGALGAALAVYLTLTGQRTVETEKVCVAIAHEMMEFVRLIVGHLDSCVDIAQNIVQIPLGALPRAMELPDPIVYKAVGDRVALTRTARHIISFYTRLSEMKTGIVAIAEHPLLSNKIATAKDVDQLAIGWAALLGLADIVLTETKFMSDFDREVRDLAKEDIKQSIAAARNYFTV